MKPKFNPDLHTKPVAVVCDNVSEAVAFGKYLKKQGYHWVTGASFGDEEQMRTYYTNAIKLTGCRFFIDFVRGFYGTVGNHVYQECKSVVNFSDFDWGEDDVKIDIDRCLSLI